MSKIYFNLDQLGDDQTLLKNAMEIALDNNPSSVMLTRADEGIRHLLSSPAIVSMMLPARTLGFCKARRPTKSSLRS